MDFIIINNMIFNKSVIRNIHATRIADTLYEIVVETDDQDYCPQTCTSEEYANETIKKIFAQLNTVNIVDGFKVEVNKEENITKIPDKYCSGVQPTNESEIIDPEEHTFRFDPGASARPKKGDTFDIFLGVKVMLAGSKIRAVDWDCYNYMLYSPAKECFVYEDGTVVDFIPYLLEHMNNNLYTICEEKDIL